MDSRRVVGEGANVSIREPGSSVQAPGLRQEVFALLGNGQGGLGNKRHARLPTFDWAGVDKSGPDG
eukprot:252600-Lingulodinium_polyedra.AAC.1